MRSARVNYREGDGDYPAADPETQRYTVILDLENPPENLLAA
jgi:hypothetical protein